MATITINGISMDPQHQVQAFAASLGAGGPRADASTSDYVLVQTTAPLDAAQKTALAGLGAAILEYVPENTYLCNFPGSDLSAVRARPYVSWVQVYPRLFKIAPSLLPLAPGPAVRNTLQLLAVPEQNLKRDARVVDIVFQHGVAPASLRDQVAALAGVDPAGLDVGSRKIRLTVQERALAPLAALDGVRHIEEVRPLKLHSDVARVILGLAAQGGSVPTAPGRPVRDGAGQVVAIADTGFDLGSTSNVHPAFAGRVKKLYALGRPVADDPDGHGTHVAGSVLGDGDSAVLGHAIRGTAPRALLVLQSVLDVRGGLGGLPDDLHDLLLPPYRDDGARVHSNSWGSTQGDGRYDQNASEVDDFIWQHRDMVVCFAAGNDGADHNGDGRIDGQSVSPPATAKNCITVGACENNRPDMTLTYGTAWPSSFPAAPIAGDRMASNPDGMVAFSSRGPTSDRRIKPDVVAPGTYILSTRSRATDSEGWELSRDPLYFYEGGTSMATPLVSGCAALVREHLAQQHDMPTPSAALVKAMLINGAHNLPGQYVPSEAGAIPNHAEGYGRIDMAATLGPYADGVILTLRDETTALDTGDEETFTVTVAGGASLKATLVWTDPAGETLQNDLDLIVVAANGRERHGNMPATSKQFDRSNNVEQVVWQGLPAGEVTITVRAYRTAQFAQTYALVLRIAAPGA